VIAFSIRGEAYLLEGEEFLPCPTERTENIQTVLPRMLVNVHPSPLDFPIHLFQHSLTNHFYGIAVMLRSKGIDPLPKVSGFVCDFLKDIVEEFKIAISRELIFQDMFRSSEGSDH